VYIAGSSIVGSYTHIHQGALIGLGSVIISDKVRNIGEYSIVGAGAVVSRDVNPYTIVAGNPAKVIRKIKL
jgi:acetyltransferase-like isoleucine patch superfamily enzyme